MADRLIDTALDRAVVPGYSRFGLAVRRRLRSWPADPPRMDGKVVLVTGASSGLGRESARRLAELGADVKVLTRDRAKSTKLARELTEETGGTVSGVTCDVSDLASVRRFTGRFIANESRLDVLINNAGVMPPERTETADGIELTFATHVLGPHVLIERLAPLLEASAPSRVINVGSGGMYSQALDLDDLQTQKGDYKKNAVYARTKRAQLVLTHEWARRLAPKGVAIQAMHPGWADTQGVRDSLPGFSKLTKAIIRDVEQGADTIVWLAASPDAQEPSGVFWHDRRPRPEHYLPTTRGSDDDGRRLWDAVTELSGGRA
jgi:dehydrogenase/reductase SDR family protein 12